MTLSEAVARTLELDQEIAGARMALDEAQGALMRAQGAFDLTFTTSAVRRDARSASASSNAPATVTQYDVGLGRRLRAGVSIAPQLTVERSQLPSSETSSPLNMADIGLALTVPLLRDRGGGVLAAAEDAAQWARQAGEGVLEHQKAVSVLNVVQAYWAYVAGIQRVAVLRDAEDRARRLLEETQTLIDAEERPAADEIRVRADYTSKQVSRLAAEDALIGARGALATAMGMSREIMMTLPPPTTRLPDVAADRSLPSSSEASELGLTRRRDLVAAQNQSESAAALLSGARSESRPTLDLSLGLGYEGTATGSLLDGFSQGQGFRTNVGFSFALPFQNRDAAGLELQQQARLQQAEIERGEVARRISLDAAIAADRLHAAAAQLGRASEAAKLQKAGVESEELRFRHGASTLFDLLFAQDALTAAALGELDAQLNYATALARLRFETGTLFDGTGDAASVDVDGLLTWSTPSSGDSASPRGRPEDETTMVSTLGGRTLHDEEEDIQAGSA